MDAIFYTICAAPDSRRTILPLAQLRASSHSLRRVNDRIPIYVFTFGIPVRTLASALRNLHVEIVEKTSYCSALEPYCGERASVLSQYPVLHRWLVLDDFCETSINSLLYLDNDTYFLSDPEILVNASDKDWQAREEPFSRHSHLGYDPKYINEDALELLACDRGKHPLPPMNLGVLLMKNRIWAHVHLVLPVFFDNLWNFFLWMAQHGQGKVAIDRRTRPIINEAATLAPTRNMSEVLRYPSSNGWIVDQISMVLALGRLQQFTWGFLDRAQVCQGYEFAKLSPMSATFSDIVLCHYFSKNHDEFARWCQAAHCKSSNVSGV